MREIKFRAWDKLLCEMFEIEWFSKTELTGSKVGILDMYRLAYSDIHLMQYTGLSDKNGVEIYEWDILRWVHSNNEVSFYNNKFVILSEVGGIKIKLHDKGYFEDSEVIGNIYENKELLKENKCITK